MRAVRTRGTAPEKQLWKILSASKIEFRKHARDLPGSPDIYIDRPAIAIFVHGCFWHGHPGCQRAALPKTHARFWSTKIASNRRRDGSAARALRREGLTVLTIWACQLRDVRRIRGRIEAAIRAVSGLQGRSFRRANGRRPSIVAQVL